MITYHVMEDDLFKSCYQKLQTDANLDIFPLAATQDYTVCIFLCQTQYK